MLKCQLLGIHGECAATATMNCYIMVAYSFKVNIIDRP